MSKDRPRHQGKLLLTSKLIALSLMAVRLYLAFFLLDKGKQEVLIVHV